MSFIDNLENELSVNLINSELRAIYFKLPINDRPIFLKVLISNESIYDINDAKIKIQKQKMKHEKKELGKYITLEHFPLGSIISAEIIELTGFVKSNFAGQEDVFQIEIVIDKLYHKGKEIPIPEGYDTAKSLGLSGYNENMLIELFGDNDEKWLNKKIDISVESSSKAKSGKRLSIIKE